jgi:lysyl-tRNA synthetase, class II
VTTEVEATGRRADQREHRLAKLRAAQERGGDAYPYRWPVDSTAAAIRAAHGGLPPDTVTEAQASLAGRLALVRRQGGLTFAQGAPTRPRS